MLSIIGNLFFLVLTAVFLTPLVKRSFARTLPLVFTMGSLLIYLFTAVGEKELMLLPTVLVPLALHWWLRKTKQGGSVSLRELGPAFWAFLLALIPALLCTGHLQLTIFDDIAHWGLFTRQMCGIDKFPNAVQSASTFSDYPPGLQMLTVLLHQGARDVPDAPGLFTGQLVWYIGLTLPLLEAIRWTKSRWKNILLVLGQAAFLLIFPAYFTKYHQMSLVVEPVMALLLGWALLTAWRSPSPTLTDLVSVSGAMSLLIISKSTGPLYAFTGMAAVAVLWWKPLRALFEKGASRWSRLLALGAAAAPPAFWLSWKLLCRLKGTSSYFSRDVAGGAYSPANLLEFFTGSGQAGPVIRHYLEYFCLSPLNRGMGLSALGFLLVFAVMVWLLGRLCPERRAVLRRAALLLTAVFLVYAVMLCYSYLYLFDPDEAEQLAAYHRYIMPLPTAMIYWGLGALSAFGQRLHTGRRRLAAGVLAVASLALCVNWVAATELVPGLFLEHRQLDREEAQWAREENELEPVRQEFSDLLRQDDTGILILTQQPQWGHYARLYKYCLLPGRTLALNPVEHGDGEAMRSRYEQWAGEETGLRMVYCAADGEEVARSIGLTDETGQPLRANTVYCMKVDGTLSWFQDLPAPAAA